MDFDTFSSQLNALVTEFLDGGGDPGSCSDLLREVAAEIFEDPDLNEEYSQCPNAAWYDTSAELD